MKHPNVTVTGATHNPVKCCGVTQHGTGCRRFRWFPKTDTPKTWYCQDHKERNTQ